MVYIATRSGTTPREPTERSGDTVVVRQDHGRVQESIGGITSQGLVVIGDGSSAYDELYLLTFTIEGHRERWFGINIHGLEGSIRSLGDETFKLGFGWTPSADLVTHPASDPLRAPSIYELFAVPGTLLDLGAGTCTSDLEVTLDPPR